MSMPLSAGARIGVYKVLSPIGAGGMGEVYRARDTLLNRDVALKVLPASVAAERDRLSRFEREAQTLAALNHPNIAQIYGVVDTPQDAGSDPIPAPGYGAGAGGGSRRTALPWTSPDR